MGRHSSFLALFAVILVAGCVVAELPSTPPGTGTASPPAGTSPSPDLSPTQGGSASPPALDPSAARWEGIGKVGAAPGAGGTISELIGFDGGYVAMAHREPFQEPVVGMSIDGRAWDVASLANWVPNCPGYGPPGEEKVPDADVAAIATNGRQVIIVGAENPHNAATCADVASSIRPIAWVSEDGRTWQRSVPFYPSGSNGRATAVWAVANGWQAVADSTAKGTRALWQSADGLHWQSVSDLDDTLVSDVYAGAAPDGTTVMTRYVGDPGAGVLRLFSSRDGRTWQPISKAGGCDERTTQIAPPRSPGLAAWVVVGDLKICTSADLVTWSTEELPIAVWHVAQTRFGAIALGDTCYGAGVDCPDPGVRAYLTVDGFTWSRLDHPKVYYGRLVADGPAGVLLLGTGPDDLDWTSVWLLEP